MKTYIAVNVIIISILIVICGKYGYSSKPQSFVESISDPKEWKKLLRTRTNILVLYSKSKPKGDIASTFVQVSRELRGTATLVQIDCSGEGKKLCKKNRVDLSTLYFLKHYKDGDFHKDYDRRETVSSMVTFLRDPTGDLPWDEDPAGEDVFHIHDIQGLNRLLKREKSFMLMFYAPWCGFCKRLKPDYSAAATELKTTYVLAAMDVNKPENGPARIRYNITGFPTLVFFENGSPKYTYEGENNRAGIVSFMKNPGPAKEKPKEEAWSDTPSDVVHLADKSFHTFIETHSSVIVMFYAPWCGHCKKIKPDYTLAASTLKQKSINGYLAAVDATQEKALATEFGVNGFPTLKYFRDGQFVFDVSNLRDKEALVTFMLDPKEPPPPPPTEKPWAETVSSVFHLREDNFKSFLKKKKHVLVMFYAPWCGHCKKTKPEFTAAAERFSDDSKVEFAAVDCTEHNQLCSQNEIRGYPSFLYFNYYKNSKPYDGGRTEDDFVNFMSDPDKPHNGGSTMPPPADPKNDWEPLEGSKFLHHLTESTFDSFIQNKKVMVLFYAPWCGHCKAMKGDYALAAAQLNKGGISSKLAYVDATIERSLASKYNIEGFPTLKYFENGIEFEEYNEGRSTSALVSYLKKRSISHKEKNEL